MTLDRLPHPAIVCGGPQLLQVIEGLEAGTYPQPEDAIWRDDLPRDLAVRLALATGATIEQIEAGPTEYADPGPAAEPEPDPEPDEGEADVIIRHTHEDGTLVYGTSKGDGTAEILKANRFRWFPSIKLWGVAQSRDHLAKRWQINAAAEALRKAGFTVAVEIDDTPRDRAEVKADEAGRLDARYERLTAAAQRAGVEAESRSAAAHAISERFAFGQPILVGHHSERRARRDHEKMDNHQRAANAAYDKAERISAAASVVGDAAKYRERPSVIRRRIDRLEAELRQVQHYLDGTRPANDWRGAYGYDREPATGGYKEQLETRKAWLNHQLAGDREALAEHQRNGYTLIDRSTVHKGDSVTSSHWWDRVPMTVTRVNPKSVTVETPPSDWCRTRKIEYDRIAAVTCPHEGRTISASAPPVKFGREAPQVPDRADAPQVTEPLAVGAGTECFTTPPAVVERMIEAAELEPGMTVLEPSAGTGAIAVRVAPLVAAVDCIELNWKLSERLRDTGVARTVQCGDFLEVDPEALRQAEAAGTWAGQAPAYDRVLMNPPFKGQADIRHVTHALGFVKPGGTVVAVMSAGTEFRQDKTAEQFRKLVADHGGWIERLPADAFEGSGTSVRTVLAVIPA